jgi:hypothetical protein
MCQLGTRTFSDIILILLIFFYRCIAAKGEGAPECDKFAKYYRALCPGEWVRIFNAIAYPQQNMSFLSIIFKVVLIRGVMNKATCELVRARLSKVFGSLAIIKWATRARK